MSRQNLSKPAPGLPPSHSRTDVAVTRHRDTTRPEHDGIPTGAVARGGGQCPSRRLWSPRRIPATLTALVVLFCAATLLFDVVRVRAGHEAAAWRKGLFDELASRPLDDVWMLAGAALAASLGVALIMLALCPGMRHLLPLQIPANCGPARAAVDRGGAAQILRDAAMRVPGVSRAKVRVRRRRVTVRAEVRFRDPNQVRGELSTVLRDELRDRITLAHTPRLNIRTQRPR